MSFAEGLRAAYYIARADAAECAGRAEECARSGDRRGELDARSRGQALELLAAKLLRECERKSDPDGFKVTQSTRPKPTT